mgnify:CR=1 FL=1
MDNMHNSEIFGRTIRCNYAQPPKIKGGDAGFASQPVWADADQYAAERDAEEAERDELSRLRDAGVVIENQRPDMPSMVRSADEVCAARGLQECAVLSCGPDALLAGLKEAIAETMTTTAFECHEETFDF